MNAGLHCRPYHKYAYSCIQYQAEQKKSNPRQPARQTPAPKQEKLSNGESGEGVKYCKYALRSIPPTIYARERHPPTSFCSTTVHTTPEYDFCQKRRPYLETLCHLFLVLRHPPVVLRIPQLLVDGPQLLIDLVGLSPPKAEPFFCPRQAVCRKSVA